MLELSRRKFFFLSLGLMGGKWMYKNNLYIPELHPWIYEPSKEQIEFFKRKVPELISARAMKIPLEMRPGFSFTVIRKK